jgi:hypothetical protein
MVPTLGVRNAYDPAKYRHPTAAAPISKANHNGLQPLPAPRNYKEAMATPYSAKWLEAMQKEIDKQIVKGTYKIVQRPRDVQVLPRKWVFTYKLDADNNILDYKARWVVCGNF